jgi:mannose-6-phosphate isomerase-like protein (cupin superfamily)
MRRHHIGDDAKGWLDGPWSSDLPISIGYATEAIDEPHRHERQTEIYLVAAGAAVATIDGVEVPVRAGDVLIVEPHEVRAFTSSSEDYRCFVLLVGGDGASDRVPVD